ncbi:universal stress protein [Methylobacterium durans]|uniref:Universal stress protein n=1 Tax=Methylobacterium durans TaxID=2202825 RepID=A0A2U8W549_9HYPH|nr:universal stress protein [Methylobacterium durans]AWN40482.1 universal stress protein [Methylobacterium durans]
MKTLFVPVVGSEGLEAIVATAFLAAKHFDSLVLGACVLPALADQVNFSGDTSWPGGQEASWAERLQAEELSLRATFAAAMDARGISEEVRSNAGPRYRWQSGPLMGDYALSQRARLFSATVVGRPAVSKASLGMASFEAILFESGRPLLLSPPHPPTTLGERILIAWNGSTETARATALAMPLLRQAKRVIVVEVEGSRVPGPSARELASALKEEGVPARGRTVAETELTSGQVFLMEAGALGCDLLVKGAYTQSRLRQMFFGGATSHILHHAKLPVLMAH